MQTEINYKTKIIINILMASMTLLLIAIFIFNLNLPCIFKNFFNINCPACGLTRSFRAILNLDFVESFKYNVLGIPLFVLIILIYILYFVDLVFKKNILVNLYEKMSKNYVIIIIVLIILLLINNFLII